MRYIVATADEIPPGGRKIVEVAGRSIGVFHLSPAGARAGGLDGEYFALRNRCPHQGGALCEGKLWGVLRAEVPGAFEYEPRREILTCPWHGWEFHVRTGQSWCEPERLRVRRYPVAVESGSTIAGADGDAAGGGLAAPPAAAIDAPRAGMVRGPYLVETYPVAIDGAYVVVDV
jgi:3-phenylpropionate/trans-cinnamate dioxygenase ferredoxin subunit